MASLLAPRQLRPAIVAIYRFARTADDIAGRRWTHRRAALAQLAALGRALDGIESGSPGEWPDLARAVTAHDLPLAPFRALLSAFAQDVTTPRYPSYAALRDYCSRSANPIGRLLLALYRRHDVQAAAWSDAICTGLQLANFWQDVAVDWTKGRVYLPLEDLERFAVTEAQIASQRADGRWAELMRFEVARARGLLVAGAPLARALGGRIGFELRLVVHGGLRILERIDAVSGDVFLHRPQLARRDWLLLGWRSLAGVPAAAAA